MTAKTCLEMAVEAGTIPASAAINVTPVMIDDACAWHNRMVDVGRDILKDVRSFTVRPPWEHTWLDAPILQPDDTNHPTARMGIELHSGNAGAMLRAFLLMVGKRGGEVGKYMADPPSGANAIIGKTIVGGYNGHRPWFNGGFLRFCDEEWRPTKDLPRLWSLQSRATDLLSEQLATWTTVVLHALGLLHVKNAELVDRDSRQVRRAAIRGHAGIRVKELVIAPMRRTLRMIREAEQANPGEPLPLHLCRGHFKTFTEERPLLGKFAGTFWWEPYLRGSEHMGVVVHDRARIALPKCAVAH